MQTPHPGGWPAPSWAGIRDRMHLMWAWRLQHSAREAVTLVSPCFSSTSLKHPTVRAFRQSSLISHTFISTSMLRIILGVTELLIRLQSGTKWLKSTSHWTLIYQTSCICESFRSFKNRNRYIIISYILLYLLFWLLVPVWVTYHCFIKKYDLLQCWSIYTNIMRFYSSSYCACISLWRLI